MKDLLVSQPVNVGDSLTTPNVSQCIQVVLPKIQLPTYSEHYEEWLSFYDFFLTLVHNNASLNNVRKLHYWKTSFTGEAASILKHIQVTETNYEQAWDILKRRYGNKRIAINAIMKRLFSQKKITFTSSLIKSLLDTTLECLHHLNNMKVSTENWDPLIIFIVTQKLDSDTHKDWEEHVSNNLQNQESLPSLDMLRKFLECRFRKLELTETTKSKTNSVYLREKTFHVATNIENNKKCQICKENHTLSHCKEFGKQTPSQRSEFIKKNSRCFNCLASGHSARQCRIPRYCRICRRRHHSLLHENKDNTGHLTGNHENKHKNQPEVALHTNVEKKKIQQWWHHSFQLNKGQHY